MSLFGECMEKPVAIQNLNTGIKIEVKGEKTKYASMSNTF